VLTGASAHHYLAVDSLRDVLAGFFAVQVLSPGLYLDNSTYPEEKELTADVADTAASTEGAALVDLAATVEGVHSAENLDPQV